MFLLSEYVRQSQRVVGLEGLLELPRFYTGMDKQAARL